VIQYDHRSKSANGHLSGLVECVDEPGCGKGGQRTMCKIRLKAKCELVKPSLIPSCKVVTVLQNSTKVRTVRCKMVPKKKEATRICKKVPVKVCKEVPCKRTCSNSGAESLEECSYKSRKVCQRIDVAGCRASQDVP